MNKSIIFAYFLFVSFLGLPVMGGAQPIENPDNGHFYECVDCGLNWPGARDFASQQEFLGLPGHLATITSSQENDFISNSIGCRGWLGGVQAEGAAQPDEDWKWITGEPFIFTWALAPGEPNDSGCTGEGGCENCLQLDAGAGGDWNDDSCEERELPCIIEYESSEAAINAIPTLTEWGLIAMAGILGIAGFMVIRKRRLTA